MIPELQQRLSVAFPQQTDLMLIRGVREGVLLADGILENEPFLKSALGRDLRGHLRRAGVLFRVHDLCVNGDLPFESRIEKMPCGNWHWIEIKSGFFRAHICRTENSSAFPVDAQSRQDARLKSQPDLFDSNVVPISKLADQIGQLYAWLAFGANAEGGLGHLCWKMPAREDDSWLASIDVLHRSASTAVAADSAPREPDKKLVLKFKDHVEEELSKKGDDKSESTN